MEIQNNNIIDYLEKKINTHNESIQINFHKIKNFMGPVNKFGKYNNMNTFIMQFIYSVNINLNHKLFLIKLILNSNFNLYLDDYNNDNSEIIYFIVKYLKNYPHEVFDFLKIIHKIGIKNKDLTDTFMLIRNLSFPKDFDEYKKIWYHISHYLIDQGHELIIKDDLYSYYHNKKLNDMYINLKKEYDKKLEEQYEKQKIKIYDELYKFDGDGYNLLSQKYKNIMTNNNHNN
jgi:hypothetical protein